MQDMMCTLKSYQEAAKHAAKVVHLTVNDEQSLFNCLAILFSSIYNIYIYIYIYIYMFRTRLLLFIYRMQIFLKKYEYCNHLQLCEDQDIPGKLKNMFATMCLRSLRLI